MKRILMILLGLMLVVNMGVFAQGDDLESLLQEDDTSLEQQLLGTAEKKSGDLMGGSVKDIIGQAVLQYPNEKVWKQVYKGMGVKEGTTVVTMENSEAKIELENGAIIDLRPKTQAIFNTLREDPEKKEMTETGIQLFVGKIYSNVKKLVKTGSKYEVKTGSATAGVRGTKFTVAVNETGDTEITTYEGTVAVTTVQSPEPVFVMAGEKIKALKGGKVNPKEKHNELPPKSLEKPVKEKKKAEKKAKVEEKKPTEKGNAGVTMEAGSNVVNGKSYGTLEIKPDFAHIFGTPIGLGLKIMVLQGDENGKNVTKYGPNASDKWYDSVSLRWAEYDSKTFGIRYGELSGVSYGQGLLMSGYSTFGIKTRVTLPKNGFKAMVPLKEASDSKLDTVYAVRLESKVMDKSPLTLGITAITDTDVADDSKLNKTAVGLDASYPVSKYLIPYAEFAKLMDFGQGMGAGFRGGSKFFNYKLEYRNIGKEFTPVLYDYYYNKNKDTYDLSKVEAYSGYLLQVGSNIFDILTMGIKYEDYGDNSKVLTGTALFSKLKFLPGMWSRLQAGFNYMQKGVDFNDFSWEDKEKAVINGYIVYPASGSVDVRIEYNKEAGEEAYQTFRTIIRF
ncbi:FecR family protein [Haliovirga abyssi]|uniref:FecR protein domain-containing protein n=1 Tax=Haliovirga abyssi TaxID=2996794 RepID=A0AAU9DUT6_9FUSO|nr:FecR family protein [Haliovirga abyssi]BDU49801.1 hypothetical protein HLVA_03700 [Haliovirga abyssi]